MSPDDNEHQKRSPTRSLADLVAPRRPMGIPYDEGDDYDAQALLTANGYAIETAELIELLGSDLSMFQAAAARLLGARGEVSAIEPLQALADSVIGMETSRVQAAYALARMNVPGSKQLLASFLKLNPEGTPAPLQAASALAHLGDPGGFPVVRHALDSSNSLVVMIACKQLYAFAKYDGQPLASGEPVTAYNALRRTAIRPEANISGEALAQLEYLNTEQARAILEDLAR